MVFPYVTVAPNNIIRVSCSWTLNTLNPTMCFVVISSFCWTLWFVGSSMLHCVAIVRSFLCCIMFHHRRYTIMHLFVLLWDGRLRVLSIITNSAAMSFLARIPQAMCKEGLSLHILRSGTAGSRTLHMLGCTRCCLRGYSPSSSGEIPMLHRFTNTRYFPLLNCP